MFVDTCFSKLPFDIIREILLYNNHFVVRNNKLIIIDKIPKEDFRFSLYDTVSKVYENVTNSSWCVVVHKKYIIRHYLLSNNIWEYSFMVFQKDPHTNIICNIPETSIYIV